MFTSLRNTQAAFQEVCFCWWWWASLTTCSWFWKSLVVVHLKRIPRKLFLLSHGLLINHAIVISPFATCNCVFHVFLLTGIPVTRPIVLNEHSFVATADVLLAFGSPTTTTIIIIIFGRPVWCTELVLLVEQRKAKGSDKSWNNRRSFGLVDNCAARLCVWGSTLQSKL